MPKFSPFKGYRYNTSDAGSLSDIIVPPYDVITKKAQEVFYAKNPNNCIRVELGLKQEGDNETSNVYTRAKNYLDKWIADSILKEENKSAFYFYHQEFTFAKKTYTRRGIIGALESLSFDENKVIPHERTLSGPKKDRMQVLSTLKFNTSPIFGLYEDTSKIIERLQNDIAKKPTDMIASTKSAGTQKLWVIQDENILKEIQDVLSDKQVFIADGHHRYETSYEFSLTEEGKNLNGSSQVMAMLVEMNDPGLVIFPYHRMLKVLPYKGEELYSKLATNFSLNKDLSSLATLKEYVSAKKPGRFGLILPNNTFLGLDYKGQLSEGYKVENLDVHIVQKFFLEGVLGFSDEEITGGKALAFNADENVINEAVQKGEKEAAILLNPVYMEELKTICLSGDKMPQKSTYFYPKLMTGLVFRFLEN